MTRPHELAQDFDERHFFDAHRALLMPYKLKPTASRLFAGERQPFVEYRGPTVTTAKSSKL